MPPAAPVPPPLPTALADPRPVMAIGTLGWLVALIVVVSGTASSTAVVTCVLGAALGVLGYGIFFWQRRAVRRGDRGSQRGLS